MNKLITVGILSLTITIFYAGSIFVNEVLGEGENETIQKLLIIRLPTGWHTVKEPSTEEELIEGYFITNSYQEFRGESEYPLLQEKDPESAILRIALNPSDYSEQGTLYEGIAIETLDLFGEFPEELNTGNGVEVVKSKGPYSTVYTFNLEGNTFFISIIGDAIKYEPLVLSLVDNFCIDNIEQSKSLNSQKISIKERYSDEHYQRLILEVKSKYE